MYVDNRSVAAFTLMSRAGKLDVKTGGGLLTTTNGTDNKLQIQRKLQETVNLKQAEQHKRKLSDQEVLIGKRSKLAETDNSFDVNLNYDGGGGAGGVVTAPEQKLNDGESRYSLASVVVQNNHSQGSDHVIFNGNSVSGLSFEGSAVAPEFQVSYNGDRLDTAGLTRQVPGSISLDKLPRKKQVVLVGSGELGNGLPATSVIKAGEKPRNKYKEEGDVKEPVVWGGETVMNYDEPADLSGIRVATNWSGGSSSDNQEEELVQYFPQSVQVTWQETRSD